MPTLTMKYPEVKNYVGGKFIPNTSNKYLDVISPIDGSILSKVPLSSKQDLNEAVVIAKKAFATWSKVPIKERVQVFFRYKTLLEKNILELSKLVQEENGKTLDEARAEVEKSIELTEFACSLPQLIGGEILEVSKGVECRTDYYPIGVVACIVPFNFPSMVPNWTIPNAIALGNTMILRPSEAVPLSSIRIAELLKEAGLPDGVLTTCGPGNDDWYAKTDDLKLDYDREVGEGKDGVVYFKGVPILYWPWLTFSLNNQRKSGVLAPTFGTSTDSGVELSLPYYWNIAPNMDATITPRVMTKRGIQVSNEFRYLDTAFRSEEHT